MVMVKWKVKQMSPVVSVAVGSYGKRPTIIRKSDWSAVIIDPTVDVDQQTVKRRPGEVFKEGALWPDWPRPGI